MAEQAAVRPLRFPVTLAHGGRALAVMLAAEVTGTTSAPDHAIAIALITAGSGVVALLIQIFFGDWVRDRLPHKREQRILNDALIDELAEKHDEIERLREEITRLKRRQR